MKRKEIALLLALTFAALMIHGYHPFAEDAEIYTPGIVKILHPTYYPVGQEFFEAHARLTLFPNLVAGAVRLTHFSLDWTLFLFHCASLFLLLLACWKIAAKCFPTPAGRWGAVAMVAALLTLPVAGTALYLFDQYFNPRSISMFGALFAIDATMERRHWLVAFWTLLTAVIHPLMAVFTLVFVVILAFPGRWPKAAASSASSASGALAAVPLFSVLWRNLFAKPSPAYWESLLDHRYYFLFAWHWYEWLGILGPLALLEYFRRLARRAERCELEGLSRAALQFGGLFFLASLLLEISPRLEILAHYQPMRSLQLVYLLLALLGGGLVGEHLLKTYWVRWIVLFAPLCAGMCYAQYQLFPADRHVEWPGASSTNPWVQAFEWVRAETPTDAVFALDPNFMALPREDHQGFRAIARRSRLADAIKDWSAAAMFPGLPFADDVKSQVAAERKCAATKPANFEQLKKKYGATWVVLQLPAESQDSGASTTAGTPRMECPYRNSAVEVCRLK